MCILWLRLGDSPSPAPTSRKTHIGLAWAWSNASHVKSPWWVLGGQLGQLSWVWESWEGFLAPHPSSGAIWGSAWLRAPGRRWVMCCRCWLTRDPRDLLQCKALGWCFPPRFSSSVPSGVVPSHSPAALGWPSARVSLHPVLLSLQEREKRDAARSFNHLQCC